MRGQAGFTLVETLIASLILVVGVLGVITVFPQAFKSATDAGRLSTLGRLAQEKLDQLLAAGYAHADLAVGTHPTQSLDGDGGRYYPVAGYGDDYSVRWIVSAGPTNGAGAAVSALRTVQIEASYDVRYTAGGVALDSADGIVVVLRTLVAE